MTAEDRQKLHLYINFKLISSGQPSCGTGATAELIEIAHDLLLIYREKNRLLSSYHCPVDRRIQDFLGRYVEDPDRIPTLPFQSFMMGARFHRKLPLDTRVCNPVDAVLTGRRNNPPEPGIRPLAVYNPIHYQELPEIWARLTEHEREPGYLISNGYLEPLEDFEYRGRTILASRLGYRITERFLAHFLGKIFDNPRAVFTSAILRPESQNLEVFVDGIENICEAQERVARRYLEDGSIEDACPPLKALIHIMAEGHYQGRRIQDPAIRGRFSRHALLESDWYQERLEVKQQRDIHLARRMVLNLQQFLELRHYADEADRLDGAPRLDRAKAHLARVQELAYLDALVGTLGADPLRPARETLVEAERQAV